jgi:periplasmic protein CpxP/Spy
MFNSFLKENEIMKRWIKRTLACLLGTVVVVGGITACSRGHRGNWSDEGVAEVRTKVVSKITRKLDLNAAQQQKLDGLANEIIAQRTAFRGEGGDPRIEIAAMIQGEKFDRTRAQVLLDQKTQAIQGSGPKVLTALADFYDSLNPEQQKEVRALQEHRRGWFSGH